MTNLNGLIPPMVHKNGTAQVTLLEQHTNALDALRIADRALAEAAPNARDFALHAEPIEAFQKASEQHQARRLMLATVIRELEALAENIAGQS